MRHALTGVKEEQGDLEWAALPILCCQAAGGNPQEALPVAAAWQLFYVAAHIMDSVEDRDEPEAWWAGWRPGTGISAATGLYFSACLALERLDLRRGRGDAARDVRIGMLKRFMEMSSGQHQDLVQTQPDLEGYWQIARAKSGMFFSMACWAGARIATDQAITLEGFQNFGLHIGLLIQVLDDLKEFQQLERPIDERGSANLKRSLPVIYALEVSPEDERKKLRRLLDETEPLASHTAEIVETIERNGGANYLYTELERQRQLALQGLDQAEAREPFRSQLLTYLDDLHAPE